MTTTLPDTGNWSAVHVPADRLRRILAAVLPCVGDDTEEPALNAVKLEIRDRMLFAVATDRYCMAVARCDLANTSGTGGQTAAETLLNGGRAADLHRMLQGVTGTVDLWLTASRVSLDACDGRTSSWPTVPGSPEFPDWRALLHKALTAEPAELGDEFGLKPKFLPRFNLSDDVADDSFPLMFRWADNPNGSPLTLVTRGDWFIGAIMPFRIAEHHPRDVTSGWAAWRRLTAKPAEGEATADAA